MSSAPKKLAVIIFRTDDEVVDRLIRCGYDSANLAARAIVEDWFRRNDDGDCTGTPVRGGGGQ